MDQRKPTYSHTILELGPHFSDQSRAPVWKWFVGYTGLWGLWRDMTMFSSELSSESLRHGSTARRRCLWRVWQFADSQGERVATAAPARPTGQVRDASPATDVSRSAWLRQRHVHDVIRAHAHHLRHRTSVSISQSVSFRVATVTTTDCERPKITFGYDFQNGLYVMLLFFSFCLFITVPLETNYITVYKTYLQQIFWMLEPALKM